MRLAQATASLEEARASLLAGRVERAEAALRSIRRVPFLGARAEAGLVLTRALAGHDPGGSVPEDALAFFSAPVLLDVARKRPLAVRSALSALLERSGERRAAVDLAELELDAGQDEAVRGRVIRDRALFTPRGRGREVATVLDLRATGPVTIVRDRTGHRLGHQDSAGSLVLAEDIDAALVPEALRIAILGAARPPIGLPEAPVAVVPVAARRALGPREPAARALTPDASAPDASAAAPAIPAPPAATLPNVSGLRVSLDLELSRLALHSLGFARGSVVLLDPRTGGVLAAVSDALTAARGGTPAFEDRREPASISKIITTAAAMRAGLDPDVFIQSLDCRGAERIGHGIVWCTSPSGRLTGLNQAMAASCNMAFAQMGVRVGRAALVDELHRWGFDHDFAVAPAGRVRRPEGDLRQLADLAIGLEAADITPLHGALLAAVMADGGRMPEPMLIVAEEGPLGLEPHERPLLAARDVIDPATLPVLARAMQAVPLYGTAAGVAPLDFPVIMKTGTGAEWRLGYHANYVGVAPWPNPRVAFSLRITHEPTSMHVNRTAREVLSTLLAGLRARSRLER